MALQERLVQGSRLSANDPGGSGSSVLTAGPFFADDSALAAADPKHHPRPKSSRRFRHHVPACRISVERLEKQEFGSPAAGSRSHQARAPHPRVVGYDEIAGVQPLGQVRHGGMNRLPARAIVDQQSRGFPAIERHLSDRRSRELVVEVGKLQGLEEARREGTPDGESARARSLAALPGGPLGLANRGGARLQRHTDSHRTGIPVGSSSSGPKCSSCLVKVAGSQPR